MRALRFLLRLFPKRHREAYGEEMWEVVRYRFERAEGGALRRGWLTMTTVLDLLASAVGEWTRVWRRRKTMRGTGLRLDARFVLRSLVRSPGYTLTAIVVIAAAVAANATVLSFVRGTLLYEPPWSEPDRVVAVWGSNTVDGQLRDVISGPNFIDMERESSTLESMAAFHFGGTAMMVDGRPEAMNALEASVGFLDVLGVTPALGRGFGAAERTSSGPASILVSHAFWRDRMDSDPAAVGSALVLDEVPHTIIGVLPEGFEFVAPAPVLVPLRDDLLAADDRARIHYNVVGRLAAGATAAEATRELTGVFRRLEEEWETVTNWNVLAEPFVQVTVSAVRPVIWTLAGVVGLVLVIALVNLATLFRIRAVSRRDELGVRVALGAGWGRAARVLSLETVTLVLIGSALGLVVTPWILARVTELLPVWIAIPQSAARVPVLRAWLDPALASLGVLVVTGASLLLTLPGVRRTVAGPAMGAGPRVHSGIRGIRLLVGVELALATVLCLGAMLTVRSAHRLLQTEVGLEGRGLLSMWVGDVWEWEKEEQVQYFRDIVEAVERVPGVRTAAVIDYPDFMAEDDYARIYFLDRSLQPQTSQREEWRRVSEGLFETAEMRMALGRSFEADDFRGTPRVAVINESFARKHYRDADPVGEFLSTHNEAYRDLQIVGVVADLRSLGPQSPAPPMLYVPNQGDPRGSQGMYVRVEGDPMSYAEAIREAVWSVDPTQFVAEMAPVSERVESWVAIPRATRTLLSWLAALALSLAAVGVFGVVAFAVRTRRSELGVRLALGASPQRLERDLARAITPVVVMGLVVGLGTGIVGARGARAVLYGVSPLDPLSMAATLFAMVAAAGLATWLPAHRATKIDPAEAMRAE